MWMYFTIEDKGHAKECTPASSLNRRLILIYRLIEKLFINLLESVHQVLDEEYKKTEISSTQKFILLLLVNYYQDYYNVVRVWGNNLVPGKI